MAVRNACIVAVRVRKLSRAAVAIAGNVHQQPVSGDREIIRWLVEQDEQEKQAVLAKLFKPSKR